MSATFEDYIKTLCERASIFDPRLMTVDVAFRLQHMPTPRPEFVRLREDTGTANWPLESWYGKQE